MSVNGTGEGGENLGLIVIHNVYRGVCAATGVTTTVTKEKKYLRATKEHEMFQNKRMANNSSKFIEEIVTEFLKFNTKLMC